MNRNDTRKQQADIALSCIRYITILLLMNIIGDLGILYFAVAIECYFLLRLLVIDCVPAFMARMIRSRMGKGQYKNTDKVWKAAVGYGIISGLLGAVVLFGFSDMIASKLLHLPEAALAIKIIAPAFFIHAVCAVLKGLFQGLGSNISSVMAGLFSEIFGLCFIMLFSKILFTYGEKAAALLQNHKFASMYGAAGAAIGIPLSVLLALAFLCLMYFGAGRKLLRKKKEGMRLTEDGIEVLKLLLVSSLPVAVTAFFLRLPILSSIGIYAKHNTLDMNTLSVCGGLYGSVLCITGILSAVAMLLCCSCENTVIHAIKHEEYKTAKSYLAGGIQGLFMFGAFGTVICLVCAPGLADLFFKQIATDTIVTAMQIAAPLVLLIPLSVYLSHILIGIGRKYTAMAGAAVSYCISLLVLIVATKSHSANINTILFAFWAFAIAFCLWNGGFLLWMMHFNLPWLISIGLPVLCAGITGLALYLLDKAIGKQIGAIPFFIIALLAGGIIYLILLFVLRCIRKKELYTLPGGRILGKIGNMLHLL